VSTMTTTKTLLIDNYDSYTFNLFQLIATVSGQEPLVVQNDDFGSDWHALCKTLRPGRDFHQVVISPGPGSPHTPSDVGLSAGAALDASVPVFGVCLGHQLLAATFGAHVVRGKEPMHGRVSKVLVENADGLFAKVPSPFDAVRYHSLVVDEATIPTNIIVTARSTDGVIMGLAVDEPGRVSVGVQFHPESICSAYGAQLVENFLNMSAEFWEHHKGVACSGVKCESSSLRSSEAADVHLENEQTSANKHTAVEDFTSFSKHRVVVQPVSCFATATASSSCVSTQTLFETLFPVSEERPRTQARFWLDSATRDLQDRNSDSTNASQTRFSFMGNGEGPLAELVEFYVDPASRSIRDSCDHGRPPHELRTYFASPDGKWSSPQVMETEDIFEYLAHDMDSKRHDAGFLHLEHEDEAANTLCSLQSWNLDFPLATGYVGFFGYGLRRFCGVKKTLPRRSSVATDAAESDSCGSSTESPKRYRYTSDDEEIPARHVKTQCCDGDTHVPDASFIFADRLLVWDHDTHKCWLVTFEDGTSAVQAAQTQWREDVLSVLENIAADVRPRVSNAVKSSGAQSTPLQSTVPDAGYIKLVEDSIEEIRAGETYEVCLTKQLSLGDNRVRAKAFDAYKLLRASNPAPYAAFLEVKTPITDGLRGSSDFAVCCSSPERFLRINAAGVVESKPIKGTIQRGETPEEDKALAEALRTSDKDRAENLMIVDLVRNDLGKVCEVGSVHVPKLMQIESFTTVHQLVSTIRGQLNLDEDDFGQLHGPGAQRFPPSLRAIQAAFPGGSMTGAPKLRTMQIIDQLEIKERGVYSGSLGFISLTGASDLNIVIRTAVVTPAGVSVGTGGAIVALSDPQGELDETKLKAGRLQSVFSSFLTTL